MPTPSNKKKPAKKVAEDPLSSSGVSSLSGISAYNIRKISIYKNGDRFHRGVKFVINPRVVKDMEPLLNQINDRIELSHGAKKLYTTDGKVISSIKELEDGKIYVAASAQFIPMRYGEFAERVWKPPSRKHSPIMSSDRIKTARTRSQEPGKRRHASQEKGNSATTVQRSRSVRTLAEDRKSRKEKAPKVNGTSAASVVKKIEMPRPKAPANRNSAPTKQPVPTAKKPPTPKRRIPQPQVGLKNKKNITAAMGAGVAVVGAAAIGAAVKKASTPKTAVSDISTASSVIPAPNIESKAAEILEFPEEEKKVDVATIHRTPTPAAASRSGSAKSVKSMRPDTTPSVNVLEAKSVSQQPTPESSEEEEDEEEDEEASGEEDEENNESDEVEEPSDEEDEEEEEEEEEDDKEGNESGVETPASRRSSTTSAKSKSEDAKKE